MTTAQLMDALDSGSAPAAGASAGVVASTGLLALDAVVGGFAPGRVWLVTGGPGQGTSTLLTQWTVSLAAFGRVQLVCPREPAPWTAARMVAQVGRVPVHHVVDRSVSEERQGRLAEAREAVRRLPLEVFAGRGHGFVPEVDPFSGSAATVVVVDDVDLVPGMSPERAAAYAEAGMVVLLGLPRHLVVFGEGEEPPLDPHWARVCDVVLEVRTRGLGEAAPGSAGAGLLRPGEADLVIHRHRWGPARTVAVGFQAHLSQFVDLTT